MRVKLTKEWRRFKKGKELVGAAGREALEDGAGQVVKAQPAKTEEAEK